MGQSFQAKQALAAAMLLALPLVAQAESDFNSTTGTGSITATARLDFAIVIPKFVFLQVGTGTAFADNATIDLITFTVPAASVGQGGPISGTGGDLTNGVVTARLVGNNGNIALNVATVGALSNGAGDSIPFTQITTTPATLAPYNLLNAPTLVNGTGTAISVAATNKIVNHGARWTYTFANTAVVPPGTYGSTVANNARATYTATLP